MKMFFAWVADKSDGGDHGSSGSLPHELMEPHQIYRAKVDMSRVSRTFTRVSGGGALYEYPEDDSELLEWCCRPSHRCGIYGKCKETMVYQVELEADSTADECIELLKEIGCENQFITCSMERADLFFAELNKDGAAKLKGVKGIYDVFPRGELYFEGGFL